MKVTDAKYGKKYNTGNYESEEYALTAIVEEKESPVKVLTGLKTLVEEAFRGAEGTLAVTADVEEVSEKKQTKKKSKKVEPVEEVEEDDEALAEDAEEDSEDEDDEALAEEDAEEEEEKPAKKKATSSPGKKFKKKEQVYDRLNEQHKDIFSSTLRKVAPDWKKTDAGKVKAKNTSMKMEGNPFLEEDGEVIPEFTAEIKKLMAAKK